MTSEQSLKIATPGHHYLHNTMTIESNSPNANNNNNKNNSNNKAEDGSSGGAAMATEESASASTFFRHPGGEIVREGHGNNSDALASRLELMEMQMEMLLQKSTSDGGDRTEEHIDLLRKGNSNDDGKPHDDDDDVNVPADTNSKSVEEFKLPRSAYTLLITTDICSLPFNTGIVALGFALICLISVLTHRIALINDPKNPFGMAVGVNAEVSVAKYVAVTIGKKANVCLLALRNFFLSQ